jgi:hypothetical protein
MELRDFIKTTLEEIAGGVAGAKPEFKKLGGVVNPNFDKAHNIQKNMGQRKLIDIQFEVSLADNSTDTKGGGIGVLLSVVSVGANKASEKEVQSLTKVEFSVPVILP